ncbi:hypothetical protein BJY01DRAFT_263246 [Aspergillus pseudoustus]|uniref:Fumarylacetoacetase-like C-terminal domain-containing protein n=1 Tax=Aspergillus pseudoustus TaxID=1810923 RepID=A0ABR4K2X7_9EURO
MPVPWDRLIRFVASDGCVYRGEPILPHEGFDIGHTSESTGLKAKVIRGSDIFDETGQTEVTDEVVTVKKLLGPLVPEDIDVIRCVGLNYAKHIEETGRPAPEYPFIFIKASTALHDHGADVIVPKIAQEALPDYEGELVLVIGKEGKNIPIEEALDYVAAYTCGNDVSARKLQRAVPQWAFSKGFDTFAPLGPCLIRAELIGDPRKLTLRTVIDGELRQDAPVSDLVFDCARLISFLSTGTTLRKGCVIMTGTPGGIGLGFDPPRALADGTLMEVSISEIGTLRNTARFLD